MRETENQGRRYFTIHRKEQSMYKVCDRVTEENVYLDSALDRDLKFNSAF